MIIPITFYSKRVSGFTCPIPSITTTGAYTTIYKFESFARAGVRRTTDSGNGGYTLSYLGSPRFSRTKGKFGDYLICNGSSNGLLSTAIPIGYNKYSMACWFNPKASVSSGSIVGLLSKYQTGPQYGGVELLLYNEAGTLKFVSTFGSNAVTNQLFYPFPFATDTWFHVAATFDNGVNKIYLNGIEVASKTTAGFTINGSVTRSFTIGYQNNNGTNERFFNGWIDEVVLVGDGVLTPTQIEILAKCPPSI